MTGQSGVIQNSGFDGTKLTLSVTIREDALGLVGRRIDPAREFLQKVNIIRFEY